MISEERKRRRRRIEEKIMFILEQSE